MANYDPGAVDVNVNAVFSGQLAPLARLLQPYFEAESSRRGGSLVQRGIA